MNVENRDVEVDFTVLVPEGVDFLGTGGGSLMLSTVNGSVRLERAG